MARDKGPILAYVGTPVDSGELVKQLGGKSKYLCNRCDQLRMSRILAPKSCGGCGSTDIDVETDMASQRLEVIRLGGRENFEKVRSSPQLIGRIMGLIRQATPDRWGAILQTVPPEEWERALQAAVLGN